MLTSGQRIPGQAIVRADIYVAADRIQRVFDLAVEFGVFEEEDRLDRIQDNLIHEKNQDQIQVLLDHKVEIRSGRSAALAEIRNLIAGDDGELEMVDRLLDSEYVALELGYFDLYYPIWFLQKKTKVKELQRSAVALLDLLGRRWTLRIGWELRDGPLTFRQIQDRCDAMSPSVPQPKSHQRRQFAGR